MQEKETKNTEQTEQQTVVILDDYSVIVTEKETLREFFTDRKNLDEFYGKVEKMARGLVADPLTKEGASQIKTCARQIASVKKKVDDYGKDVVAELKALPKIIDKNRADFREKMEALQEEIRRPVTEIEEREEEIASISQRHVKLGADAASGDIQKEIESVKAIELTEGKWHESLEKAQKTVNGELNALNLMLESALKREEEQRELAELRKKKEEDERIIRENKIKEEAERKAREEAEARAAAEKARLEREKAEAERKAAEAERARQEAEERARREAMQREEEKAKARYTIPENGPASFPQQQEEKPAPRIPDLKPSKWTPEMKAVNCAIVDAIAAILEDKLQGFTETGYKVAAQEIVKSIIKGRIRNLKVVYHE